MGKKVRSARGEIVDFDLLKIKNAIASAPKPLTVAKREDFIDKKARRRMKKVKDLAAKKVLEDNTIVVNPTTIPTEDETGIE